MTRSGSITRLTALILALAASALGANDGTTYQIKPLTEAQAEEYKLDIAFYKKCTWVQDILITTSDRVSDLAHLESAYQFDMIMKSIDPDVAQRIRDRKVLCILIGHDELTSDVPQYTTDKTGEELDFYNWRRRGFLSWEGGRPTVVFAEEDVLEYEGGMQLESILIHEFGHVIHGAGFDKELQERLTKTFKEARDKGLWNDGRAAQRFRRVKSDTPVSLLEALIKSFPDQPRELLEKCLDGGDILVNGKPTSSKVKVTRGDKVLIVFGGDKQCYAGKNRAEYWAEGVQCWYDTNRTMDHDHNHIHTRSQLKAYDPGLAALCVEVLGDTSWRFVSPRKRASTGHLEDFNPATAPRVEDPEHIKKAANDYYDKYWASFWQRLRDKYEISSASASAKASSDKPNILFIMSDDHSYQAMGIYGSRLAKLDPTPNLDRFARKSMIFDNVFCTNSICTPSRASIMTGQYSHRNGVYDLYDTLPGERHALSREMQKAGYTTAVVGKWHLKDSPKFFDYYAVIAGQGRYMNPTMHVSEGGTRRRVRFDSTLSREIEVVDYQGHSSDVLTDISMAWLKGRDQSRPFFLMHQFKAPHDMFVYARRYEDYLKDTSIPEPDNLYDQPGPKFGSIATRGENDSLVNVIGSTVSPQPDKRNLSRYYRRKVRQLTGKERPSRKQMTHHSYQLYLKEYLRCVKGIDDNLQRLLDYLRESGLMEKTVIIYTSDQGMMLGEHDYIDKRWMYEESIRMPLIVHHPKLTASGGRCDWLINNTDFAPTLLDMAGVKPPGEMQGSSFFAALNGMSEPQGWRQGTYYRYWMHMAHGHNNPGHFGIRTKTHKLIFFYGMDYTDIHNKRRINKHGGNRFWKDTPAAWELYDLSVDPGEMHNRYRDPDYRTIAQTLKEDLQELRRKIGDTDEDHPRILEVIKKHWND